MKLFIVAAICLTTAHADMPGICRVGGATVDKNGLEVGLACDDDVWYCHRPTFKEYTGLTIPYGCGRCDSVGGTRGTDCDECYAKTDSGGTTECNAYDYAQVAGTTFKCVSWEYKDSKIVRKEGDTLCQLKKDSVTPVMCHGPTDTADSAYVELNGGCGPCDEPTKSAGKCSECDVGLCNVGPAEAEEEGAATTFKCASWEYKDGKFVRNDEDTVCAEDKVCNGPTDTAGAAYVEEKDGCGPCDVTAELEGKCKDCYEELCNSAATMTTLLATMTTLLAIAAIIYNMA